MPQDSEPLEDLVSASSSTPKKRKIGVVEARIRDMMSGLINFYHETIKDTEPGWPSWAQILRIHGIMHNDRILNADGTGINGKTFAAVASKIIRENEYGSINRTLVIAPNGGLLNAWAGSEIDRYASKMHARKQKTVTIEDYVDLKKVTNDTDFVVLNWEKLRLQKGTKRFNEFKQFLESYNPSFFVLDEVHNAKSISSLTTQTLLELVPYTYHLDKSKQADDWRDQVLYKDKKDGKGQVPASKDVMLLSATPIPNRYKDLSIIFHLLNPIKYTDPRIFRSAPADIMRELLGQQVWFRLTRDQVKDDLGLPDLLEEKIEVELTNKEAEIYFRAWSDCVMLGAGFVELRKILYNPSLSKYADEDTPKYSSKMLELAKRAKKDLARGEKVAIHTSYVTGVIEPLTELLGKFCKVEYVIGDVDLADRKDAITLWRNSKKPGTLILSSVGNESMDMTTGKVPVNLYSLEPEMTPREYEQLQGRFHRRGQEATVTHRTLVAKSEHLNRLMMESLDSLSEEYGVEIPKNFRARTIDADLFAMRIAKQKIIEKIYGCVDISKIEQMIYDADSSDKNLSTYSDSLFLLRRLRSKTPWQQAMKMQAEWRNLGEEKFGTLIKRDVWKEWREFHEQGWERSISDYTLQAVGAIIDTLPKKQKGPYNIVDVCSGAAYFSRATGKEATCVDIDRKFLKMGREKIDEINVKLNGSAMNNSYIEATATNLEGITSRSTDILVNSYGLMYLGQDENRHELEEAVLEVNRVLKDNGYHIIALPHSTNRWAIKKFSKLMQEYGFKTVQELTPDYFKNARRQTKSMQGELNGTADDEGAKQNLNGALKKNPLLNNGAYILVYQKQKTVDRLQGISFSFYDNARFLGRG